MASLSRKITTPLLLSFMAAWQSAAMAGPITVDGRLSDWGISVADGTSGNTVGTNYSGLRTDLYGSDKSDTNDTSNSYSHYPSGSATSPGSGGQNYDAEFMGVLVQGNTLYISILTGQRPDNGLSYYSPGDIRITGSVNGVATTFGIEVGGGTGGASGTATTLGAPGSTYTLNSGGTTTSVANTSTGAAQHAGALFKSPTWINDPIAPSGPTQINPSSTGTFLGDSSSYIFTENSYTTQHAVIELAIDLSLFGANAILNNFYWRPSCGNDELNIIGTGATNIHVTPEPATLALLGVGSLGLLTFRRRRKA